jgi:hypothetical protein
VGVGDGVGDEPQATSSIDWQVKGSTSNFGGKHSKESKIVI